MAEATEETPKGPGDEETPVEVEVDASAPDGVPGDAAPDETTPTEPAEPAAPAEPEPAPAEPVKVPVDEAPPIAPRRPAPVEPDETDKEFDAVAKAIDEDEMLSPSQKAQAKLDLRTKREDRTARRQREAGDRENAERDAAAAGFGVSRKLFDEAWTAACAESGKQLGYFSADAARILLNQKIAAAKAAKPKPSQDPPKKGPAKPAAQPAGQILPRSPANRLAPAGAETRTVMERMQSGDKALMKEIAEINQGFSE